MKQYEIELKGCDDITRFNIELSYTEALLIKRLSVLSEKASSCICMPKLEIHKVVITKPPVVST